MLTESFIAASSAPPKLTAANSSQVKDAGIFLHTLQPQPALRSAYKKSATAPNGLAVTSSHVFAAQVGKAVVHVYNRDKGSQEATVPFPERIHSIAAIADGSTLVLGTEGGRLVFWEVCTGRLVSTSTSHLQPVTALAVNASGSTVLSGAADATVLSWSLDDVLSFSAGNTFDGQKRDPRHTLSGHNGGINAIAIGHSALPSDIAVSVSADSTANVWDYHAGVLLRTFLLTAPPLCVTLDSGDRAAFVGHEDGSVQRLDFFSIEASTSLVRDPTLALTPAQPPAGSRWIAQNLDAGSTVGAALSVSLSYYGTILLSGHASGAISAWDVASGRLKSTVVQYAGAPITNLQFERPLGFPSDEKPTLRPAAIVKPRPHEAFSGADGGEMNGQYCYHATLEPLRSNDNSGGVSWAFERYNRQILDPLHESGFRADFLEAEVAELAAALQETRNSTAKQDGRNGTSRGTEESDFMALDGASEGQEEVFALRQRVAELQEAQKRSFAAFREVQKDRQQLKEQQREQAVRRARKLEKRQRQIDAKWEALGTGQQAMVGKYHGKDELRDAYLPEMEGHEAEDSDGISTTSESSASEGG